MLTLTFLVMVATALGFGPSLQAKPVIENRICLGRVATALDSEPSLQGGPGIERGENFPLRESFEANYAGRKLLVSRPKRYSVRQFRGQLCEARTIFTPA
jgi:hypothetical protein